MTVQNTKQDFDRSRKLYFSLEDNHTGLLSAKQISFCTRSPQKQSTAIHNIIYSYSQHRSTYTIHTASILNIIHLNNQPSSTQYCAYLNPQHSLLEQSTQLNIIFRLPQTSTFSTGTIRPAQHNIPPASILNILYWNNLTSSA